MEFLRRTWAEIDLDALDQNVSAIRTCLSDSTELLAVVKADAYGHGDRMIAKELTRSGVTRFGVSNLEEAVGLRHAGIDGEILIFGVTPPELAKELAENDITQAILNADYAKALSDAAVAAGVTVKGHLKLDTGMGRFGFLPQDVTEAAALLKSLPSMRVEGVFTHFANTTDEALTRRQYQQFQEGAALLERAGIETGLRHVCASSAFLRYPEMQLDAVRLGSALLGRLSVPDPLGLEKIGWLETQVMELKDLPSGWKVGYTGAYRTKRPTRLALLPAGYTSGVGVTEESNALRLRDRVYRLLRTGRALLRSNGLTGLVNGRRCPVRGVVGATQLALDVTDVPCAVGDTVRLEVRPKYVDSAVPREYR